MAPYLNKDGVSGLLRVRQSLYLHAALMIISALQESGVINVLFDVMHITRYR